MIPKGKGKTALLILSKLKDRETERDHASFEDEDEDYDNSDGDMGSDEGDNAGLETAMAAFCTAVKDRDYRAMAEALCSFMHQHESCEGPDE